MEGFIRNVLGSVALDLQAAAEAAGPPPQATRFACSMKTLQNFAANMAASLDGGARSNLNLVSEELKHPMDTVHIDHWSQHPG